MAQNPDTKPSPNTRPLGAEPRIVIMGAGPGGLCMGIKLRQAGFRNFVIVERSAGVGGTWNQNRYPGCACDIPSHLYSFSFEVKKDWSRPYAPQPEILEYLEGIANKYGLLPFCRFQCPVAGAYWDDATAKWTVQLESGETLSADIVVSAIGMFNSIVIPEIPGLAGFEGKQFHSARWDCEHSLAGKRVGVIGSAASAVQLIPEVAKQADQLHVFQRSADWVLPKEDEPYTEEQLAYFRTDPEAAQNVRRAIFDGIEMGKAFYDSATRQEMETIGRQALEIVKDPALREKLTPTHMWGCKRPLFSNDYYATFNRENVGLVTDPIESVTATGIVTEDRKVWNVDTIVFATGFSSIEYLSAIEVTGKGGLDLTEAWSEGAQAFMGVSTSGFPNLFMLYGPNTNQGSLITMIEWQVDHVVRQVERFVAENLVWMDVRADLERSYNDQIQKDIESIEPWTAGCNSYYRATSGRIVTQWPKTMAAFRDMIADFDPAAYETAQRS